jgi:hypothetical protein
MSESTFFEEHEQEGAENAPKPKPKPKPEGMFRTPYPLRTILYAVFSSAVEQPKGKVYSPIRDFFQFRARALLATL